IHDDVNVARPQSTPSPKESKRKTRGQLKPVNQYVTASRKHLFDALLSRRMMRHITEIGQQAFSVSLATLLTVVAVWSTSFDHDRKRRQHPFSVAQRDDHRRRFGRKDVVRKTR